MNMQKNKRVIYILLAFVVMSIFIAVYLTEFSKVQYSQYIPPQKSVFKITFEYPSKWEWRVSDDDILKGDGLIVTTGPDIPENFGGIILIFANRYDSSPKTQMDKAIAKFLATKLVNRDEVLSDRVFKIDGYDARQFTIKSTATPSNMNLHEPLITERIYILVENSYYHIDFSIAESMRDNKFGKGFDHMIESIKFMP